VKNAPSSAYLTSCLEQSRCKFTCLLPGCNRICQRDTDWWKQTTFLFYAFFKRTNNKVQNKTLTVGILLVHVAYLKQWGIWVVIYNF
jgi:hypothetical protein